LRQYSNELLDSSEFVLVLSSFPLSVYLIPCPRCLRFSCLCTHLFPFARIVLDELELLLTVSWNEPSRCDSENQVYQLSASLGTSLGTSWSPAGSATPKSSVVSLHRAVYLWEIFILFQIGEEAAKRMVRQLDGILTFVDCD